MSEAEKQEGQKTVVAFITGLLIGGLLVWVFSSSPEKTPTSGETEVTTEETGAKTETTPMTNDAVKNTTETTVSSDKGTTGTGVMKVANQKAGDTVTISVSSYPATDGWVVVRDYTGGVAGKILGAARYSTGEGLLPTTVSLLRATVKGSEYQATFYTESGDKKFSTTDDTVIANGAVTFKAE